MINKDTLRNLISIGSNNTDVDKTLNTGINLVVRCVKHHGLIDILMKPEDDNVIFQALRESHQLHKNIG